MRLRQVIFWAHLLAGTVAGIVILVMSITGVLLTYERQLGDWADLRLYRLGPPYAGAQHRSLEALLRDVQEHQTSAQLTTVTVRTGDAPVAVTVGPRTLFVNPYSGEVLGEGAPNVRAFFRRVRDWHRWLGVAGPERTTARAVTGACNLAFLFLVTSGFYLWWPRKWSWRQIRNVVWFRRGLTSHSRDFNWHNTFGFWCSVPLFIVVLSGTVISYRWSSDLVYRLAGEDPPRPAAPVPAGLRSTAVRIAGVDDLLRQARQQVPAWRTLSFRIPGGKDQTATVTIDEGTGGEPQKRSTLVRDLASGQLTRWEPFSAQTRGRRWRSWLRFAHTGEAAGLAGQTIAGIASAAGAVLVWTGIGLALRRFSRWRMATMADRSRAAGIDMAREIRRRRVS
jgi:uncharacterized iron-regulated membrane protein